MEMINCNSASVHIFLANTPSHKGDHCFIRMVIKRIPSARGGEGGGWGAELLLHLQID